MPKLLFVVNNPDFFVSHRLGIAEEAIKQGYEVSLACPEGKGIGQIECLGVDIHRIPVKRTSHGWLAQFRFMLHSLRICRAVKPDLCHLVTLKTFLVAGFAAKLAGIPCRIGSISGLGFLFISESWKTRLFRFILRPFFRWVMAGRNTRVIFQNDTDKELMIRYVGLAESNCIMIRGSGVDLDAFPYVPEPEGRPQVVMASRLLKDKGVMEYVQAARMLKEQGVEADFILAGEPDVVNPATVTLGDIQPYIDDESINWIGHCDDIAGLFARSHIVVLPSYREGFPKVLIEAAACGRVVVTTDVPGCRDAIINGETGLLVRGKDSVDLANAIQKLTEDADIMQFMGRKAHRHAKQNYSVKQAIEAHIKAYSNLTPSLSKGC